MPTDLVIAGLSVPGFDALAAMRPRRLAPSGELFFLPVKQPGYPGAQAANYHILMRDRIIALKEDEPVSLTLAYIDYRDASTAAFIEAFAPFALVRPIRPITPEFAATPSRAEVRNYQDYLVSEAQELRNRASRINEFTNIRNLSPFLLPQTNFASRHHRKLVTLLFWRLGISPNVTKLLRTAGKNFERHHPRVKPATSNYSCYSDKHFYFCSPGGNRHGYFRHEGKGHAPTCVLAARSRFGGSYAHDLHYDCQPVTSLAASYPNCHGEATPPKAAHVNICPNDYVS